VTVEKQAIFEGQSLGGLDLVSQLAEANINRLIPHRTLPHANFIKAEQATEKFYWKSPEAERASPYQINRE
jgi:hypothetical protein